jgi:hypothetical protein
MEKKSSENGENSRENGESGENGGNYFNFGENYSFDTVPAQHVVTYC